MVVGLTCCPTADASISASLMARSAKLGRSLVSAFQKLGRRPHSYD